VIYGFAAPPGQASDGRHPICVRRGGRGRGKLPVKALGPGALVHLPCGKD